MCVCVCVCVCVWVWVCVCIKKETIGNDRNEYITLMWLYVCFFFFYNLVWRFYLHWPLDLDSVQYSIYKYLNCSSWNCSQIRIYWIRYCFIYIYIYIYIYRERERGGDLALNNLHAIKHVCACVCVCVCVVCNIFNESKLIWFQAIKLF